MHSDNLEGSMGKGHYLGGHTIMRLGPRPSGGKHLSHFIEKEGYLTSLVKNANPADFTRPETHPDVCAAQPQSTDKRRRNSNRKRKPVILPPSLQQHFVFGRVNRTELLQQLESAMRTYAQRKGFTDAEVAKHLNKAGYRTACGARWNATLISYLWKIRKEEYIRHKRTSLKGSAKHPANPAKPQKPTPPPTAHTNVAEKLSQIGRVVSTK